MYSGEADFATQVFVRLVDRLLVSEAKNASEELRQQKNAPKWAELYELLVDEPEYEEARKKCPAYIDNLDVAIAVLKRKKKP